MHLNSYLSCLCLCHSVQIFMEQSFFPFHPQPGLIKFLVLIKIGLLSTRMVAQHLDDDEHDENVMKKK